MSQRSQLTHLVRGGQTFLHHLRMLDQILQKLVLVCLSFFVLTFVSWILIHLTRMQLIMLQQWATAWFWHWADPQLTLNFISSDGSSHHLQAAQILSDPTVQETLKSVKQLALGATRLSVVVSVFIATIGCLSFILYGHRQIKEEHIRGARLNMSGAIMSLLVVRWLHPGYWLEKVRSRGCIKLAGIALGKNSEQQHFLIHGTTGTGKSVCIHQLLDQIRARGERAIIYDKSGDFTKYHYQEGHDQLLSPFDSRTVHWDLWDECLIEPHYISAAAALIPADNAPDPFWSDAARALFTATAIKLKQQGEHSITALKDRLFNCSPDELKKVLKDDSAKLYLGNEAKGMQSSIQAKLATQFKRLEYLPEVRKSFSIRRWLNESESAGWLFIPSVGDLHATLKPLISLWLDIAINELLSLRPNNSKRTWIILDELPSLDQLPNLSAGLAESRKFGGCFVLGIQNYSQLSALYGAHQGADAACSLISLLNTRVFFRSVSQESAHWASQQLGQEEIKRTQEGNSFGASPMRDGVNMSKPVHTRSIVLPAEIQELPDLQAYLRLPVNKPVRQIKFSIKKRKEIAFGYMPADSKQIFEIKQPTQLELKALPQQLNPGG